MADGPRGWRWDGQRWVVDSPDGRWLWDGQAWRPAADAPRPARAGSGARIVAAGLIGVLVLVAALGVGGWLELSRLRAGTARPAHATPSSATSAAPPASANPSVAAFIPIAEKFVEDHRGLKFKEAVDIQFLSDSEFQQRLLDAVRQDEPDLVKEGRLLRALGLVAPGTDLVKAERSLLGAAVVGYYDPQTKKLVVRGQNASPATRHVLVHELTHALQDQHFALDKAPSGQAGNEPGEAFLALVEGDAVRIEQQYIGSLSAEEQRQATSQSAGSAPPADVPLVLLEILAFPYQVGPAFTQAVLAARGQSGLDAAFSSSPPTTTAQLLQPQRYLAGIGATPVAAPSADGAVIDQGALGELGLLLMLDKSVSEGKLSQSDARSASQAWAGDKYVGWDQAGQSCLRDQLAGDGPAGNAAILKGLQAYVAGRSGARLEGTGPFVVTSCA